MRQLAVVRPDLSVTDGPFAEAKELVGGYSMVQAPDLAAAVELILEGLHLSKRLNKEALGARATYRSRG